MGVQNKQIGWSTESNLLWDVLKKISQLTKVVSNISISGGGSGVQTVTGNVVNNTDPLNPVIIGLTLITDTAMLTTAGWSLIGGLYEQNISNVSITSSSVVYIIPDNADIQTVIDAVLLPRTDSSSGSVKVYSQNLPAGNIGVTLNIWN
jgi:hypothetical protein